MSSLDMMEMSRFLGILETEFMLLESVLATLLRKLKKCRVH